MERGASASLVAERTPRERRRRLLPGARGESGSRPSVDIAFDGAHIASALASLLAERTAYERQRRLLLSTPPVSAGVAACRGMLHELVQKYMSFAF